MQTALGTTGRASDGTGSLEELSRRLDFCAESAVMDFWRNDSRFADPSGRPRELPVFGPEPSFFTLVAAAIGSEVPDRIVGQLLLRLRDTGTIEVIEDNRVRVLHEWYAGRVFNARAVLESGSRALGRLAINIEHNLKNSHKEQRLFQRDHWSRRIRREHLDEVRRRCQEATKRHQAEIEHIVEEFEQRENQPDLVSYGVGCYHWQITDPREV